MSKKENVKCVIRLRPPETYDQEKSSNLFIVEMNEICVKSSDDGSSVLITSKDEEKVFAFDWVANEKASQTDMYKEVGDPLLNSFIEGYNCTLFTYGQTGAGKTFTMLGPFSSLFDEKEQEKAGIIPRLLKDLFKRIDVLKKKNASANVVVKCSCFEIYQEQVIDLVQ